LSVLSKIEAIKPFTEREAWGLFRLAALAEAVGWTFLIAAVLIRHYKILGYKIVIPIAGQIHGTFFIIYFGILFITYTSLGWSRKKFLVAILAGIPPYGTLVFEQWNSIARRTRLGRAYLSNVILWTSNIDLESNLLDELDV
jgi:integral membrane protein